MTAPDGEQRSTPHALNPDIVFPGPSEMAARCRALDWSSTPLGPVGGWPAPLLTVVRTCLESTFPINLWCGPSLVLIYNDAYRRVLGAKHPQALGRPGLEVWAEIRADVEPMFAQMYAGGAPIYAEDAHFVMTRAESSTDAASDGGADAWFTFGLSPVRDTDGTIVAFFNPAAETTDRVLGAQRLELLNRALAVEQQRLAETFRQSPSFLAVLRGSDNVIEFANDAYQQMVGRGRTLVGRPLFEALPETHGQGFDDFLAQVRTTGDSLVLRELPVLLQRSPAAPPEERYVDVTYLPLVEADGTRDAVIAHGSDVTEQVRARREIERLLAESESARAEAERARVAAESANRAKADFLSTMSHELRTPLNAIAGYTDLLAMGVRGVLSEEQQQDVERIRRANRHMTGLVEAVLGFARLEAGRVEFHLEPLMLGPLIAEVEALVRPQLAANGVQFDHDEERHGAASRAMAHADPEKVRQILLNLLTNAVKFTAPGGRVSLACEDDAEGGAVRVHTHDTGRGIPADKLEAIFEPFVQVDRQGTPGSQQGVGLGLAISRDLARGMGGDLSATSVPGVGSTFTLTLPRAGT